MIASGLSFAFLVALHTWKNFGPPPIQKKEAASLGTRRKKSDMFQFVSF